MATTTWRKEISKCAGDDKIVFCTLTENELDTEFDNGFWGAEGVPFTAWSAEWVYFPVVYDGSEWVGRVPRNPCSIASHHHGSQ